MERHFEYPASIEQDSAGFYLVTFPDFPEAASDARSRDDALSEETNSLEEAVAGPMERGDDIPAPSPAGKDAIPIALPALYSMKAAPYVAMRGKRNCRRVLSRLSSARMKGRCGGCSTPGTRAAPQRSRRRCTRSENGFAWLCQTRADCCLPRLGYDRRGWGRP